MYKLFFYIAMTMLFSACDSNVRVKVGNLATAPEVSATALDGYSSPFTPEIDVKDDYQAVVWTKKSGPGNIIFSDPTILKPEISADTPGDYVLVVTITSTRGISTETEFEFTWYNTAPADFSITAPANEVATLKPNMLTV